MTSVRSFVVAYDGSEFAKDAAKHAMQLMDKDKDEIIILHVIATSILPNYSVTQEERQNAEKLVAEMVEHCKRNRVRKISSYIEEAYDVKREICAKAKSLDADYLVIGSRGISNIQKALLGSVSEYAVRNSNCPVIVIHKK